MKHFTRLSALETNIIKLDIIESLFRSISYENMPAEKDLSNILSHLSEQVESVNKGLSENFYKLWEEVRNEEEYVSPSASSDELVEVMASWQEQT